MKATMIKTKSLGKTEISVMPTDCYCDGDGNISSVEISNETILIAADEIRNKICCSYSDKPDKTVKIPNCE